MFHDPTLRSMGERYNKNAGQAALRWLLQQDSVVAIPRSASEAGEDLRSHNVAIRSFDPWLLGGEGFLGDALLSAFVFGVALTSVRSKP
jgi:hypothetical protein